MWRSDGSTAVPASRCTTRRAAQRGHIAFQPHAAHSSDGAKPRRLMNSNVCSSRASRAAIAAWSAGPIPSTLPGCAIRNHSHRRKRRVERRPCAAASANGNVPVSPARSFPATASRCPASYGNVAQPCAIDRDIARVISHALLLLERRVLLLVDDDQAEPWQRREHGKARPDKQIASPLAAASHCRRRSPAASLLCSTAVRASGNAPRMRSTSCGVRLISGTSSITCLPAAITRAAAAR